MQSIEVIKKIIEPLNQLGVQYIVTGSIASLIYGNPRLTHDIDLVLNLNKLDAEMFLSSFDEREFYLPPIDIFLIELQRDTHGHQNLIHINTGFKADLYFAGRSKFQLWALNNYQRTDFFELSIRLAPVEYVIIQKLIFYREAKMQKHIIDIQGIIENSKDIIDIEILDTFLKEHNLTEIWYMIKNH